MVTYQPEETPPVVGATATYNCDQGFFLRGNNMHTCGAIAAGMWDGSDPVCLREYSIYKP